MQDAVFVAHYLQLAGVVLCIGVLGFGFFVCFLRFYLYVRERESQHEQEGQRGKESQADPTLSSEPSAGSPDLSLKQESDA